MYQLTDYLFDLPDHLIAQEPMCPRDHSKLMVIHRKTGEIEHRRFFEIQEYLNTGDLLVSNNTKVIGSRLLGRRLTGGKIEIFLLKPLTSSLHWETLYKSSKKAKEGLGFFIEKDGARLDGRIKSIESLRAQGTVEVEFDSDPLKKKWGEVPFPPYIKPNPELEPRYETTYAKIAGSVAAPTAGFHFTPKLISKIESQKVSWQELTLHVGLGTFRPIKVSDIRDHKMHSEYFQISEELSHCWRKTRDSKKKIIAVGTTSLRSLESAWKPLNQTIKWGDQDTNLFLYPGKEIHSVDALITNFHLPDSTLLLLVSAFAGKDLIKKAYQEAIGQNYRFYSFGDAMLIL